MSMTKNNAKTKNNAFLFCTIEDLVPADHLVRKLESVIDWNFIYKIVEDLYSTIGRRSIDPVVLFKMVFINYIFGINSMRKTCKEIQVNLAYRWFLGLDVNDSVPNFSTYSKNYERRFKGTTAFDDIFGYILKIAIDNNMVDTTAIFGDSTHIKASANKGKSENLIVEKSTKTYQDALDKEITEDRILNGKKPLKKKQKIIEVVNNETGEITTIEAKPTKNIKVSKTDPTCGMFHKGEKEKMFAFTSSTFCDKRGFVLGSYLAPGNVHDSVSFYGLYYNIENHIMDNVKYISLDAGYVTPHICKTIFDDKKIPIMPYKRPMTKKGFFKKYEFVYDEYFNIYICPEGKTLKYATTNRDGNREYKSNKFDCAHCPSKSKCTQSNPPQKQINRHLWESFKEETEHIRHSDVHKEIYPKRKETIERVFADGKENHCLRYTRYRGINRVNDSVMLIYASMNLKKLANWLVKPQKQSVLSSFYRIIRDYTRKYWFIHKKMTLSF